MVDFGIYTDIMIECKELGLLKNKLYGDNSLKLFDGDALFIRIIDKCERLKKLYQTHKDNGIWGIDAENVEDTLKDMINYSVYLLMQLRGQL